MWGVVGYGGGVILYAVVATPGTRARVGWDGRVSLGVRLPPAPVPSARGLVLRSPAGRWYPLCRESGLACTDVKSMCGVGGVMLTRRERRTLNRVPEANRLLGLEALTTPGLLQDRAATAARLRYICAELLEAPCGEPRDRLKAAELLAKLDGAFAPERHVLEPPTRRTPDEMRAIVAWEVGAVPAPSPSPAPVVAPPAVHTRDVLPEGAGSEQPSPVRAVGGAAKPAKKAKGKTGGRK